MAQFQLTQLIICSVCVSKKIYPSFLKIGDFSIFSSKTKQKKNRKFIIKVAPILDIAGIVVIVRISPQIQGEVEWDSETFP